MEKRKMNIAAVILAGGYSKRLGFSKQMLKINNRTLLEHLVLKLQATSADKIMVILNQDLSPPLGLSPHIQIHTILHSQNAGIGSSIRFGSSFLEHYDACLFVTCDQIFLTSDNYESLLQNYQQNLKKIICSRYENTLGIPCIFPRRFFPQLAQLSGNEGAKKLIYRNLTDVLSVRINAAAMDVDTAKDLQRYGIQP